MSKSHESVTIDTNEVLRDIQGTVIAHDRIADWCVGKIA